MSQYTTLDVLNNKFPCEGPKVIPVILPFTGAVTSLTIDLKATLNVRNMTNVQAFFIDNSAGSTSLTLNVAVQNQNVVIPPFSQAYITILGSVAQFTFNSAAATALIAYALNFPVTNSVWSTQGAAGAQNVNVTNAPTITGITNPVGIARTVSLAYLPATSANIAVTLVNQDIAIVTAVPTNIRFTNTGLGIAHIRLGSVAQVAVLTDLAILPNQSILINANGASHIGVIGEALTTLNYTIGTGGI